MKSKLFIFLFTVVFSVLWSQDISLVDTLCLSQQTEWVDTDSLLKSKYTTEQEVNPKRFKNEFEKKYQTKDFDYSLTQPRESLWEKLKRQLYKLLDSIFGNVDFTKASSWGSILFKVFITAIVILVLYFLVRFLLQRDGNIWFAKRNEKSEVSYNSFDENIHEIDFPKEILYFEQTENYRFAIRYLFLKVLKELSIRQIIDWKIEKTNKDYFNEIKVEHKPKFASLVQIFEKVWYGKIDVDKESYMDLKKMFEQTQF